MAGDAAPIVTPRNDTSHPDWVEFVSLGERLRPGFGSWTPDRFVINELTGLTVPDGPILCCVRQWLPRMREMTQ